VLRASPQHQCARPVPLAYIRLVIATTTPTGFPCRLCILCVHAAATTSAKRPDAEVALFPRRSRLPRINGRVGLRITHLEDCSAFTRVAACTLAKLPEVTLYTEGFSHFVASMTAPIASGWSDSCRVGLSPTGRAPPFHGAR
jgi:hypothetical protein